MENKFELMLINKQSFLFYKFVLRCVGLKQKIARHTFKKLISK